MGKDVPCAQYSTTRRSGIARLSVAVAIVLAAGTIVMMTFLVAVGGALPME